MDKKNYNWITEYTIFNSLIIDIFHELQLFSYILNAKKNINITNGAANLNDTWIYLESLELIFHLINIHYERFLNEILFIINNNISNNKKCNIEYVIKIIKKNERFKWIIETSLFKLRTEFNDIGNNFKHNKNMNTFIEPTFNELKTILEKLPNSLSNFSYLLFNKEKNNENIKKFEDNFHISDSLDSFSQVILKMKYEIVIILNKNNL